MCTSASPQQEHRDAAIQYGSVCMDLCISYSKSVFAELQWQEFESQLQAISESTEVEDLKEEKGHMQLSQ